MTFEQAKKELVELANGKYCALSYELSIFSSVIPCYGTVKSRRELGLSEQECDCTVYIDGEKHCSGATWRAALDKMRERLNQFEVKPEEQPGEELCSGQ